jgi:hypothetical protein
MKSTLDWFAVTVTAIIATDCVVLRVRRRWREEHKARVPLHWRQRRRHAEELQRIAWENRRLIWFNGGPAPTEG